MIGHSLGRMGCRSWDSSCLTPSLSGVPANRQLHSPLPVIFLAQCTNKQVFCDAALDGATQTILAPSRDSRCTIMHMCNVCVQWIQFQKPHDEKTAPVYDEKTALVQKTSDLDVGSFRSGYTRTELGKGKDASCYCHWRARVYVCERGCVCVCACVRV